MRQSSLTSRLRAPRFEEDDRLSNRKGTLRNIHKTLRLAEAVDEPNDYLRAGIVDEHVEIISAVENCFVSARNKIAEMQVATRIHEGEKGRPALKHRADGPWD